ncbi:hypothetical protein LWI29_036168 [Acer saccharum]|uniref:ABC-type xenobiotic transporter n=1 Tax=Acer saccharum TaxID=4024 RepID=A0AA39TF78_ACESA|nr:hypothetical protein LWI29_036168 [Acer saccharum]
MRGGMIVQSGKYEELFNSGMDFGALVAAHETSIELAGMNNATSGDTLQQTPKSPYRSSSWEKSTGENRSLDQSKSEDISSSKLIKDEERETGHSTVLKRLGSCKFISAIFVVIKSFLFAFLSLRTAQSFFNQLLSSILHAPMLFFDTTPSGRVLTRVSTDQANVDLYVPMYLSLGYYLTSSREMTRLDLITKAPVIHHFSETISSVMAIHAFRRQGRFFRENINKANANLRMDFHNNALTEWLGFRLELIGIVALCIATLLMNSHDTSSKFYNQTRILKMFFNFPEHVRYRPNTPHVLKGITLRILRGEKIGVVGRTRSGKSTLVQVFFRLIEPLGGKIIIDGVDICKLGLHDLRSRFGIIPQEPVLFEGTVRMVDSGANWSVGQTQFLCLVRVMIKHSKILFLDEATASVDSQTDAFIQNIICEDFASCTIISVAYRIPSVMDSDRVLVIDAGQAKEFDKPSNLLERTSLFAALVQEYANRSSGL